MGALRKSLTRVGHLSRPSSVNHRHLIQHLAYFVHEHEAWQTIDNLFANYYLYTLFEVISLTVGGRLRWEDRTESGQLIG